MPPTGITLYLRSLRPINPILAKRSFHKFYFQLERKFEEISFQVTTIDPVWYAVAIQDLLSSLLSKANRFILLVDSWIEDGLLDEWMSKDANRLWEMVVRYVYKKRGMKFDITGYEYLRY